MKPGHDCIAYILDGTVHGMDGDRLVAILVLIPMCHAGP